MPLKVSLWRHVETINGVGDDVGGDASSDAGDDAGNKTGGDAGDDASAICGEPGPK